MFRDMNKRFLYVLLAALILMILGLILIGVAKTAGMNGFDMLKDGHINSYLSDKLVYDSFKELGQLSTLTTLRAGIVFAVILTPITAAVGIAGSIYDFIKSR